MQGPSLRYHGWWIDGVWKSRSDADALKENPINLYILIVIKYNYVFEIFWNVIVEVILKEISRNTASFKLVCFRAWIIGAARLTSEIFSHTLPSKRLSAIFHLWLVFVLQPPKVWYYQCGRSLLQKRPELWNGSEIKQSLTPIFEQSIHERGYQCSANSVERRA